MAQSGDRFTRRHVLAGGAMFLGGAAQAVGSTSAYYHEEAATGGAVRIDGDPTLNYDIVDDTRYGGAAYRVSYQAAWVADFDRIEIRIENVDRDYLTAETVTRTSEEGTAQYPSGGGSDGSGGGDTYEFEFRVYGTGSTSPVIQRTTTDVADGSGQSEGEMGTVDDVALDSFDVADETQYNTTDLTVDYRLANFSASNFGEVRVSFDNASNDWSDETVSNSDQQDSGTVTYQAGGTEGHTYEITVEVRNENGLVVDSGSLDHVSGGDDSQWP